jgi:hypothetical protein
MDIFDTFFLVEYLRQWAARGRVVLITMQPPTYEIFTMISKVTAVQKEKGWPRNSLLNISLYNTINFALNYLGGPKFHNIFNEKFR